MGDDSTTVQAAQAASLFAGEAWFDPIEAGIRERIRGFIEALFEEELTAALGRGRCERAGGTPRGYRNGTRERHLLGSFGPVQVSVPRARMAAAEGGTREWRSAALPRYARMTRQVEALIAGAYLAGTNTRRVKRALAALFRGAVGKDVVSRTWHKVKTDWEAWNRRDLAGEEVVRLLLDGTVVRVRLDRKATNISLLVALGVRRDGQKLLLAVRNMGGESEAAWRGILDDLIARGLRTPEFLVIDGAAGVERALAALWPDVPAQRCTVHKHRNLLAHAPETLHEEISADYTDMIYAASAKEVEAKRKAFLRKWRLKCPGVAASLEEAGDRLFAFLRLPPGQWKSARTTNAIERLHEEFKRRIKTQTVLPSAETAAMLFWALLASGQITMRKIDGWQTSPSRSPSRPLTSPPEAVASLRRRRRRPSPTAFATAPRRRWRGCRSGAFFHRAWRLGPHPTCRSRPPRTGPWADSGAKRNGLSKADLDVPAKLREQRLERGEEAEALARRQVVAEHDLLQLGLGQRVEVEVPGQVAAQAAVGVLHGPFLPRRVGVAEPGRHRAGARQRP